MYFPHWECHSAVKHVADLDNKPFTDLQHHQQQYYPADYVAREYLSYPECKPGSDVSPSTDADLYPCYHCGCCPV